MMKRGTIIGIIKDKTITGDGVEGSSRVTSIEQFATILMEHAWKRYLGMH